jgi:hypothetical protein
MVNAPTVVQAKEPPVINTEEIQKDPLKDPVAKADLIALGTITDKKYEVVSVGLNTDNVTPGKFAYTLYTLSVEKVLKGDPSIKEAIIRAEGGYISDRIYQGPTGRHFRVSDHVLVGLFKQKDDVYIVWEGENPQFADSVFWIQGSAMSIDPLELIMGRICKILRINGIPISLNEPCPE